MRTIDQETRRSDLAGAVWRLLERAGVEAASVRNVASEAGLSSGSVRHFFGTQRELHVFAMRSLVDRVSQRVQVAAQEPDVRRRAVAMVSELVPLREDTTRELAVWWEFVGRSRHDAELHQVVVEQAAEMRGFLRHVLEGLAELGETRSDRDVDRATAHLAAVVDGLTFQLLTTPEQMSRDRSAGLLEDALFHDGKRSEPR